MYARRVLKTICRSAHVRLHSALLTGLTDDLPLRAWATASSTLRVSLALSAFQAAGVCATALSSADQPCRRPFLCSAVRPLPCNHCGELSCSIAVHSALCPHVSVPHLSSGL